MVSSKCWAVVSPSPLRFLAALMPPCAQTECERLTGTIENRSTVPPASAILMTAASPASPPPTTMIFGAAIESSLPSCNQMKHTVRLKLSGDDEYHAHCRSKHLCRDECIRQGPCSADREPGLVLLEQLNQVRIPFVSRRAKLCPDAADNKQAKKPGCREGDETTPKSVHVCHLSSQLQFV